MTHSIAPCARTTRQPAPLAEKIQAPAQPKPFTRGAVEDGRDGNRIRNFMHRVQAGFTRRAHQPAPTLQASAISGPFPHVYPVPGIPTRFPGNAVSQGHGADVGPSVPRNNAGYPLGVPYETPHLYGPGDYRVFVHL
ncbi:MAG: hypothetical protein ACRYGA_16245 [Janthinobacterium lividum]